MKTQVLKRNQGFTQKNNRRTPNQTPWVRVPNPLGTLTLFGASLFVDSASAADQSHQPPVSLSFGKFRMNGCVRVVGQALAEPE